MNGRFRLSLLLIGIVVLVFAAGFVFQQPWATQVWPFQAGRMSNLFIGSILAAVAAPIVWIGIVGETRAMAGGAVNLAVTNAGFGVYAMQVYVREQQPRLLMFALLSLGMVVVCAALFFYSRRFPLQDRRPTPMLVRISFVLFAVVLILAGGALALQQPRIFPWPISPETSTMYGWIFLGDMSYFVYALLYPYWGNARGQLLAFLAYDLVLIPPFLAHFRIVPPEFYLSLVLYTTVLVYSGLIALYFLLIHPATRFAPRRKANLPVTP